MTTIFRESFETDGNGTRYSTSVPEFTDGSGDFFTRTDGANIGTFVQVSGADGAFWFGAQDIDGEGAAPQQSLLFENIDISGITDLGFSVLLAEDDASDAAEDWDLPDFVRFEYRIDSGTFQNLLWIESVPDGDAFNAVPALDTDFDGNGDGATLTDQFQRVTAAIAGTGSRLDLRVTFDLDAGDEDIAIDDLTITGTVAAAFDLQITEIWFGQDGTDLTGDWFEITNTGTGAWTAALHGDLHYDDDSADPAAADPVEGIATIAPGSEAILAPIWAWRRRLSNARPSSVESTFSLSAMRAKSLTSGSSSIPSIPSPSVNLKLTLTRVPVPEGAIFARASPTRLRPSIRSHRTRLGPRLRSTSRIWLGPSAAPPSSEPKPIEASRASTSRGAMG